MYQQKALQNHAAAQPAAVAVGGWLAGLWARPRGGTQVKKPGPDVAQQLAHLASHAGSGRGAGGALVGPHPTIPIGPFSVGSHGQVVL